MLLMLRHERNKKGWSQEYIADQLNVTPETVHYIETGQRKPSFDVLVKLLDLFGKKIAVKQIRQLFAVVDDTPNSQINDTMKKK